MEGENIVQMQGNLVFAELKETRNNNKLYKAKIAVPFTFKDRETQEQKQGFNYFPIVAWGELAEDLAALGDRIPVRVQGALQTRSYKGNCKSCAAEEKKYWTNIVVNNFAVVE